MSLQGLALVLAEGITADQLRQLAAVMLGLVVFAAIFVLVERQRVRRGGDQVTPPPFEDAPPQPPVEYPPWTPPPPHGDAPAVLDEAELKDELPVPFVPRGQGPARATPTTPPAVAPPAAAPAAPAPAAPAPAAPARAEELTPEALPKEAATVEPAETAASMDQHPEGSQPESPAEIGIIIPDEPAGPGKAGES
jgi:hypothetical protein